MFNPSLRSQSHIPEVRDAFWIRRLDQEGHEGFESYDDMYFCPLSLRAVGRGSGI
jgi:hypothetical protein